LPKRTYEWKESYDEGMNWLCRNHEVQIGEQKDDSSE